MGVNFLRRRCCLLLRRLLFLSRSCQIAYSFRRGLIFIVTTAQIELLLSHEACVLLRLKSLLIACVEVALACTRP